MWVFGPFIASLRSAEVGAFFSIYKYHPSDLAYATIIVYSMVSIVLIPI